MIKNKKIKSVTRKLTRVRVKKKKDPLKLKEILPKIQKNGFRKNLGRFGLPFFLFSDSLSDTDNFLLITNLPSYFFIR